MRSSADQEAILRGIQILCSREDPHRVAYIDTNGNSWKISVVGVRNKLRRVSIVGSSYPKEIND